MKNELRDLDLEVVVSGKAPPGGGAAGSGQKSGITTPGGSAGQKSASGIKGS